MEFVAIALGVVVAVLAVRWARRLRRPTPAIDVGRIDPFTLGDPWRRHVAAALTAKKRYDAIVGGLDAGPLRARLAEIGMQVDRAVHECWDIAKRGDALDDSIRSLDGSALRARLDRAPDEVTATSLRNQLASLERVRTARDDAEARLSLLQTKLGEIPSQAAEMRAGVDHTAALGTAVDDVVVQLQALTQAVGELDRPGGPTAP